MIKIIQNKKCIADIHIEGDERCIFKLIENLTLDINNEKPYIDSCEILTTTTIKKEEKEITEKK